MAERPERARITRADLATVLGLVPDVSRRVPGHGLHQVRLPGVVAVIAALVGAGFTDSTTQVIGNLSSIGTPIVIGLIVTDDSLAPGFACMTVITIAGILSYVLLVGKVERVAETTQGESIRG